METLAPIMAEHPFLTDLPPRLVSLLVGCATNVRFQPGEFIYRRGDEANRFYLLRHGRAGIEIEVPGKGSTVVHTVQEGDVLGWSWLIPPYRWRFDARALLMVRAIALDGKCLRGKFEQDPELGYEMLKRFTPVIVNRLEATRLQLLDLYGMRN